MTPGRSIYQLDIVNSQNRGTAYVCLKCCGGGGNYALKTINIVRRQHIAIIRRQCTRMLSIFAAPNPFLMRLAYPANGIMARPV